MLNGDRGKADYTVSAGDLMTDTHNAPSADDRHHEERTDEDAKCCIAKPSQTFGKFTRVSYVRALLVSAFTYP